MSFAEQYTKKFSMPFPSALDTLIKRFSAITDHQDPDAFPIEEKDEFLAGLLILTADPAPVLTLKQLLWVLMESTASSYWETTHSQEIFKEHITDRDTFLREILKLISIRKIPLDILLSLLILEESPFKNAWLTVDSPDILQEHYKRTDDRNALLTGFLELTLAEKLPLSALQYYLTSDDSTFKDAWCTDHSGNILKKYIEPFRCLDNEDSTLDDYQKYIHLVGRIISEASDHIDAAAKEVRLKHKANPDLPPIPGKISDLALRLQADARAAEAARAESSSTTLYDYSRSEANPTRKSQSRAFLQQSGSVDS